MAKITGREYAAQGEDDAARSIHKRRAVYRVARNPTPEQQSAIEVLEKGFHGFWDGRDPYDQMRRAEALGVELGEEELRSDGRWWPVESLDARMTTMQMGAVWE